MSTATATNPTLPADVKAYFSNLGRLGGKSRSPRKLAASRQNVAKATAHRWAKRHQKEA